MRFVAALIFCVIILVASTSLAQTHLRMYACALANDDPGAFMGGSSIGAGLWTSDDTAKTWKHIGWSHVKGYSVDAIDSSFGKILYLACGNGCMRSSDAGEHWRMLTDWQITEVMDVAIDQSDPKKISIATSTGNWISNDSGEHWKQWGPREFCAHLYYDKTTHKFIAANAIADTNGSRTELQSDGSISVGSKRTIRGTPHRGALWCIAQKDSNVFVGGERGIYEIDTANVLHLITGSPRNIHSMVVIGNSLYAVSLSGSVWTCDIETFERKFLRSGLDSLQLWSIKSKIVQ